MTIIEFCTRQDSSRLENKFYRLIFKSLKNVGKVRILKILRLKKLKQFIFHIRFLSAKKILQRTKFLRTPSHEYESARGGFVFKLVDGVNVIPWKPFFWFFFPKSLIQKQIFQIIN